MNHLTEKILTILSLFPGKYSTEDISNVDNVSSSCQSTTDYWPLGTSYLPAAISTRIQKIKLTLYTLLTYFRMCKKVKDINSSTYIIYSAKDRYSYLIKLKMTLIKTCANIDSIFKNLFVVNFRSNFIIPFHLITLKQLTLTFFNRSVNLIQHRLPMMKYDTFS